MRTDRDAWQALALLAGFVAFVLAAVLVLDQVFATPFDGARAALVFSVALISFMPVALWLERRPVVTGGPHCLRRRMRSLLGLLALRPPPGPADGCCAGGTRFGPFSA